MSRGVEIFKGMETEVNGAEGQGTTIEKVLNVGNYFSIFMMMEQTGEKKKNWISLPRVISACPPPEGRRYIIVILEHWFAH